MMAIQDIATQPFTDQRCGTAGLRKKVAVFQQPHYLENFLQSIFDALPALKGAVLVIGGDGRFHNRHAIQTAIRMAAANGVARVIVGQGGLLSTPAASHLISVHDAAAGFLFTASHNPAGADGDFGIKVNLAGGGQATEALTEKIYAISKALLRYRLADGGHVDLDRRVPQTLGGMTITVVDPVDDYAALMQQQFDFDRLRTWLKTHTLRFDAMHAVTGPYARRLFVEMLGAPESSVVNACPLEDFGGGHPDPNLIHAKALVDFMYSPDAADFAAASDGDGDRNLILGKDIFISPGDSLAMLAAHAPKLKGVARSMPTCRAVDRVAQARGVECHETPTGWKFFASLLDAGRISLCGEESFGTSSNHVREKDGVWAALAWLDLLARTGASVKEIAHQHWETYGRHYYARHDYENLPSAIAAQVMDTLRQALPTLRGKSFGEWQITTADEFNYKDPVTGEAAHAQGLRLVFGDAARLVLRLSGTGTQGATLRIYFERYTHLPETLDWDAGFALAPLAALAVPLLNLEAIAGRNSPDVVT